MEASLDNKPLPYLFVNPKTQQEAKRRYEEIVNELREGRRVYYFTEGDIEAMVKYISFVHHVEIAYTPLMTQASYRGGKPVGRKRKSYLLTLKKAA